jgi:hypothetical protein
VLNVPLYFFTVLQYSLLLTGAEINFSDTACMNLAG